MLKRKINRYLIEWKERADKKPLIVKVARQVGKTASIECYARLPKIGGQYIWLIDCKLENR